MGSVNDEVLQSVATPIENKINIVDYSLLNSYLGYLIGLLCTGSKGLSVRVFACPSMCALY